MGAFGQLRGALSGRIWILGTNSGTHRGSTEVPQIQFIDFLVVEAELEYLIMRQSTEAYGNLSFPLGCSRSSHLEKWCIILLIPVSGSLLGVWVVGVWVLLVEYGTLDFSEDDFVRCAMLGLTVDTGLCVSTLASGRISHIFYVDVGSDFGVFSPAKWRSLLSRCFDLSPCTRCSPLEYRHYFYELMSWIRCDDVGHFSCFVLSAHFSDSPVRG